MKIDEQSQSNSLLAMLSGAQQTVAVNNNNQSAYESSLSTNFQGVMQEEAVQLETSTFAYDMIAKLKDGMSFTDALQAQRDEDFAEFFQEALAKNGGNIEDAIRKARDQMQPSLSDEELIDVLEGLAAEHATSGNTELAKSIREFTEELRKQTNVVESELLDNKEKTSNKAEGMFTGMMLSQEANSNSNNSTTLLDDFIDDITTNNSSKNNNNSNNNSTEREKREMQAGIQQYQKVVNYM